MASNFGLPAVTLAEEDYGLQALTRHKAALNTPFPAFKEETEGLGIHRHEYIPMSQVDQGASNDISPTGTSEGIRTRSGRSVRRTDSPSSTSNTRVSKSPAKKTRRAPKSKLDKSKTPRLTAPLSEMTKDMSTPLKDISAWVNRSAEDRHKEVEKRNGYITRPMNSFMLYRSAYAERTKQWCLQNNHQIVSSVSGESWPMEPEEVRNQYDDWAKLERANHQAAHPDYKFSPTKAANKRRRNELDEDEAGSLGLDEADGEYSGTRNVRQRWNDHAATMLYIPHGFDSNPYYGRQSNGFEQSQYQYANEGRSVPSNVAYDGQGRPYNPRTNVYIHAPVQRTDYSQYNQSCQTPRVQTPVSASTPSLGGYGLPGGQAASDDTFPSMTSPMQQYSQYAPQQYSRQPSHYQQQMYQPQPATQMYENQPYLPHGYLPQHAIDPSLEPAIPSVHTAPVTEGGQTHEFQDSLKGMTANQLVQLQNYYHELRSTTGVDDTLAPTWLAAQVE